MFEIIDILVWFGVVNMVVVDFVVVLIFKFEFEGDMGDSSVGVQVCLMSQVMWKLMGLIVWLNCMVIFIN